MSFLHIDMTQVVEILPQISSYDIDQVKPR